MTTLVQYINYMATVTVKKFQNLRWSSVLIIRQNVNMANNAIMHIGLTSRTINLLVL